jgi:hypothetical protein
MANATYNIGKRGVLDGTIDHDDDTLKVVLFTGTFTFNIDHADVAAVVAANTEATGYTPRPTMANIVVEQEGGGNRVFIKSDDTKIPITGAQTVTALVTYWHHASGDGSSLPIAYYDITDTAVSGDGYVIQWNS